MYKSSTVWLKEGWLKEWLLEKKWLLAVASPLWLSDILDEFNAGHDEFKALQVLHVQHAGEDQLKFRHMYNI